MSHTDFPELLKLAQTGDRDARERLFQVFRGQLKAFIVAAFDYGKEPCWDASDTVQQSLLEAHRDFTTFRGQTQEEFLGWLQTIARHDVADRLRYQTRKKRPPSVSRSLNDSGAVGQMLRQQLTSDQTTASQRLMSLERRQRILSAIDKLPPEQATAMRLRHLQGLTLAEMSECTGKSVPAITGLLTRGVRGISERLRNSDE